jgi:hypothetical protein
MGKRFAIFQLAFFMQADGSISRCHGIVFPLLKIKALYS